MQRSERMGGPHTFRGVWRRQQLCSQLCRGGLAGRLLDLSRNREVRVWTPVDSETSLKSSRLTVPLEVQPAHIMST